MSSRLKLHLGRHGPKSIDPEPSAIEVSDDFAIELHNHGHPLHVHIAPQADLGRFLTLEATNLFIEGGDMRTIGANLAERRPRSFDGKLRVATGFGVETAFVDVRLREEQPVEREVVVDASLAQPKPAQPATPLIDRIGVDAVPIFALASMALLIAIGATMIAVDVAVILGVIAVLLGVTIAVFMMLR